MTDRLPLPTAASRPHGKRCVSPESGLSLLEVLIAVAIFALTVMSLFVIRGRAIEQAYLAKNLDLAQRYGKEMLESIMLQREEHQDGEYGEFEAEEARDLRWEVFIEEVTVAGVPAEEDYDDQEEAISSGSRDTNDRSSSRSNRGGGNGGLFGEEGGEGTEEVLNRVVVNVYYPVGTGEEKFTLETYIPLTEEQQADRDERLGRDSNSRNRQNDRNNNNNGGGGGGGRNNRRNRDGGDIFGG